VILVQLGTKTKYIWDDARLMMSWGLQRARSRFGVAANW
jgi:D-alanyl-D-alanine carboxypeptidase (penicillin-binding protein 5/6)